MLVSLLKQYASNYKASYKAFLDFWKQESCFGPARIAWEYSDRLALFWYSMENSCPILSLSAMRVLTSIANSVPLERVFSNMNYIHSKIRNSLDISRASMLQFEQMNSEYRRQEQEADIQN
jgi:hypothetical protein